MNYTLGIIIIIILWIKAIINIIKYLKGKNNNFMPSQKKSTIRKFR